MIKIKTDPVVTNIWFNLLSSDSVGNLMLEKNLGLLGKK